MADDKKGSLLPWLASARERYKQYHPFEISLREQNGRCAIIRFALATEQVVRDKSGVVVLEEGSSWAELKLTRSKS